METVTFTNKVEILSMDENSVVVEIEATDGRTVKWIFDRDALREFFAQHLAGLRMIEVTP